MDLANCCTGPVKEFPTRLFDFENPIATYTKDTVDKLVKNQDYSVKLHWGPLSNVANETVGADGNVGKDRSLRQSEKLELNLHSTFIRCLKSAIDEDLRLFTIEFGAFTTLVPQCKSKMTAEAW